MGAPQRRWRRWRAGCSWRARRQMRRRSAGCCACAHMPWQRQVQREGRLEQTLLGCACCRPAAPLARVWGPGARISSALLTSAPVPLPPAAALLLRPLIHTPYIRPLAHWLAAGDPGAALADLQQAVALSARLGEAPGSDDFGMMGDLLTGASLGGWVLACW